MSESTGQEEIQAVQPFNLDGLRNALGIVEAPDQHQEVAQEFKRSSEKLDRDLANGFYVWVVDDDLGHLATYNSDNNGVRYILSKTIINGAPVRQTLSGEYDVSGHKVNVRIDQKTGSPFVSCRIFLNNSLIASRTDPFDEAGHQADAFLRTTVESGGDDPSRLDSTIEPERSPYSFVMKLLRDFSRSKPDEKFTESMFVKMQDKDREKTRWAKDYHF